MLTSFERTRLDRDEVASRVLQTKFTSLRGKINISSIRCHLYEQRAIDTNIYDKLTDANSTTNDKSELLLRHLISKGEEGYKQLVQALRQCGKEDPVQASLANDLEQRYSECCSDGVMSETRDSSLNMLTSAKIDHQEIPSYSPANRQHHSDHGGRYSESSSISSTMRVPSSAASHQISGHISTTSESDQSCTGKPTIEIDHTTSTTIKILVLGDKGVGKSSLILKYAKDDFDIHETPTANLDVISSIINFSNKKYVINFWDPAGQSRPNTLTRRYFQGAHGALLLYDCTRPETLDSIVNWQKELSERVYQRNGDPLPTVLVGTKCDHESCDKASGGSAMCLEYGFLDHFLASAKTGKNLKQSVDTLLMGILGDAGSLKESHYNEGHAVVIPISDSSIELHNHPSSSKNKCCS